jgi:hypothetical protein
LHRRLVARDAAVRTIDLREAAHGGDDAQTLDKDGALEEIAEAFGNRGLAQAEVVG